MLSVTSGHDCLVTELYPSRRNALRSDIFEAWPFVQGRSELHKVKTARIEVKDDCNEK
jgi:hypothetical protein